MTYELFKGPLLKQVKGENHFGHGLLLFLEVIKLPVMSCCAFARRGRSFSLYSHTEVSDGGAESARNFILFHEG